MTIEDKYSVIPTIVKVARNYGVDPDLAVAIARQESGLNPWAVGDKGSSFGLFQLHIGGELPRDWQKDYIVGPSGRIPRRAADPEANASVSLRVVGNVAKSHPSASPGTIAALAQRPADQTGYARSVNSLMGRGANYGALTSETPSATAAAATPGLAKAGLFDIPNPFADVKDFLSFVASPQALLRAVDFLLGIMAIGASAVFLGLALSDTKAARGASHSATTGAKKLAKIAAIAPK